MRIKYILVLLLASLEIANAQFQNYVLKDPDPNTNSHTYVGRDYVRLTNGYKFSAVAGVTMNAKVNSGLSTDDANKFVAVAIPTGGSSDEVTGIDKTLAVGQIPISSSVSQSGAKCYNVPIEIVPGRQGFQPNISLSYNSQAGNGLVGMGWNISGLSSIERVNKNKFYDGVNESPNLDLNDAFSLDGVRLIKTGTSIEPNQICFKPVQGNATVTAYLNKNIVMYFKVQYPNGTVANMGYTDNNFWSRISYPVTSLTDMNGNKITFSYILDQTGETTNNGNVISTNLNNEVYYIDEINYGEFKDKSNFAKIKFIYEERTDQTLAFQSYMEVINRQRLYKIQTFINVDSVRSYQLYYSNNNQRTASIQNDVSRIIQINSFANGEKLNPLNFYYGENIIPSIKSIPVDFSNENFDLKQVYAIRGKFDINPENDALLVFPKKEAFKYIATNRTYSTNYLNNEQIKVYQNIKDGSTTPCKITTIDGFDAEFTTGDGFEDVFAANIDGKGQDEIVKVNKRIDDPRDSNWEYLTFNVYGINGNRKLQLLNTYDYTLGELVYPNGKDYSVTPWKFYTGNFTGRGKTEVLALSKDNYIRDEAILIELDGGGSNIFTQTNLTNTDVLNPEKVYPIDIDGDGQTEIVDVRADQTYLFKFVDGAGFQSIGTWALTTNDFNELNARQIMFADLNGDGNIDIISSPKAQYTDDKITCASRTFTRTASSELKNARLWVNEPYMECDNCGYPIYRAYRDPDTWNIHCIQSIKYDNKGLDFCSLVNNYNYPNDIDFWKMVPIHNTAPLTFPLSSVTGCNYPIKISSTRVRTFCPGCGKQIDYDIPEWDFNHCWKCGTELVPKGFDFWVAHLGSSGNNCSTYCPGSAHGFLAYKDEFDYNDWSHQVTTPDIHKYTTITTNDWIYQYTNGRSIVKTETIHGIARLNNHKYSVHEVNGDDVPDLIIQDTNTGNITIQSYDSQNRYFKNSYISTTNNPTPVGSELIDYELNSGHSYSALLALSSNKLTSCEFPFNHTLSSMISLMVNGLGVVDKTEYSQLSQGTNYTIGNTAKLPYADFSSPMWVVAQNSGMNNKKIIGNVSYRYKGAILHNQGLGFLGFSSMESTDLMTSKVSTTEYDPFHYGVITKQTTEINESNFIYNFTKCTNTKILPLLTEKKIIDKLKGITITTTYPIDKYDEYGYCGKEIIAFDENTSTTIENKYGKGTNGVYLLGVLTNRLTTNVRNRNSFCQIEDYVYNDYNHLQFYKKYIGPTMISETEYVYYPTPYNNIVKDEIVHNKITNNINDDLTTSFTYWSVDQCSLETKKDAMGLETKYSYYPNNRLLKDVTDYKGNKITYGYNANWRRKNSETTSGGTATFTSIDLDWNKDTAINGVFKITQTSTGQPSITKCADVFGRETHTVLQGFANGSYILAEKEYDNFGHLKSSTAPYNSGETPLWTMYNYDEYDRPISVVLPNGSNTTYTYDGNKKSENKDGVVTSQISDASGMLVSSEDGGGKVTYTYRPDGQPDNVISANVKTSFEYIDDYNRQTKLIDPSAGTVQTSYDDANHTVIQTWNSGKNITTVMNKFGQLTCKIIKDLISTDITSTYVYDSFGRPFTQTSTNNTSKSLDYDIYGRLEKQTETVNGKTYQEVYGYDNQRISSVTYNTGPGSSLTNLESVLYKYNTNGYLYQLVDGSNHVLRQVNGLNALGEETNVAFYDGLTTTSKNYTPEGLWTDVTTTSSSSGLIQNMHYDFNRITGTLNSRSDVVHSLTESFTYDVLSRLKNFGSKTMGYNSNGNILTKTDVGVYTYPDDGKPYPYTLSSVNTSSDLTNQLNVDYTVMSRPTSIRNTTGLTASFTYNDDFNRATMQLKQGTTETLSKIYLGGGKYEIETVNGIDKQRLYVDGSPYDASVLLEKTGSISKYYYLHRDYLGSITQITNNSGNLVAEYSYDAWGRMRNPVDWTLYTQSQLLQLPMPFGNRGYTGHEQLNQFGLINMNARLYDPLLARFLAPDPQVSAPETSNGFNRFIYASNNPLMYTDPNGEQSVREFNPYWYLFPHSNLGGSHSSGPNSGSSGAGFNTGNAGTGPSAVGYQDYNSGFSNGNGGGIPDGSLNGVPGLILYGIDLLFNHNPDPRYLPHNVTYSAAVVQNANTKPINLSKPVGTGASMVYSGGGNKKSQGNSNSSWINEAQYGIPVWGSCLQSSEALNKGDFLNAACFFGLGFFEAFTLGEGTEVRLGINATKESITTIEKVAVHGNSLKSLKPTWGYKLFSEDGTFLKNGITSKLVPQSRYTRVFMKGKYLEPFKQFPNRLEAWQWEYQQNLIQRGPLNLNMH